MLNRSDRARIAAQTLDILQSGTYDAPSGASVTMAEALRAAADGTTLIAPGQWPEVFARAAETAALRSFTTAFEVKNQTTFAAASGLVARFGPARVSALNFASARNPGGGFLSGSQAQEESLARGSGLYSCLLRKPEYYEANRKHSSSLYTDHLIVSPRVPVIRDDNDGLLEQPWEVTIITCPAPNAGAIAEHAPVSIGKIVPTFRRRIEMVLSAALAFDQTALVLGAWGCGVFGNDPTTVAGLFGEFLLAGGKFAQAFEYVIFAVLDRGEATIRPFDDVFGQGGRRSG